MINIRKCKKHGVCINCFKQQETGAEIYELRASSTGQGWTTIMLCKECMIELVRTIPKAIKDRRGGDTNVQES